MKKNGFVMVETLIVTVFVLAIFTVLFEVVYPLAKQYKKVENFRDINALYAANYVRSFVNSAKAKTNFTNKLNAAAFNTNGALVYANHLYVSDNRTVNGGIEGFCTDLGTNYNKYQIRGDFK